MSIRVTCPGCHVRFNVSDKFAGRQGPCPKCKASITIPAKSDEVVVHEADVGPKDSKGRSITKPIFRQETQLSGVQITLIASVILLFFIGALVLRFVFPSPDEFPVAFLWAGSVLLAIPCVFVAYTFLRDQELGAFSGQELWLRVGICGALYAITWLSLPIAKYAFDDQWGPGPWIVSITAMLLAGGGIALASLDFDYLTGVMHFGLYLAACLSSRMLAGIGVLPGWFDDAPSQQPSEIPPVLGWTLQWLGDGLALIGSGL